MLNMETFPNVESLAKYLEVPVTRSPWKKLRFVYVRESDVPAEPRYRKNPTRIGHPWLVLESPDEPGVSQILPRSTSISDDVPNKLKTEKHANRVEKASDCKCGINRDAWISLDLRIPIPKSELQTIAGEKVCWNESKDVVDQIHLCLSTMANGKP